MGYCKFPATMANCVSDPTKDQSYKYWDSLLSSCVIIAESEISCTNLGGNWIYGKTWVPKNNSQFDVSSQAACESLDLCSLNNGIQSGNCGNAFNCVGRCPRCQRSFF